MSTDVLEKPAVDEHTDKVPSVELSDGTGPAAHIVQIPEHLRGKTTPQAYTLAATVEGFEVEALCGYRWIPSRDPKKLPVCAKCYAIFQDDPHGHGDRDQLPDA